MLPHPLSLITITLGILLTLRKLDVGHRLPSHHPSVSLADFEQWKATAMGAYGFGVWSCFLKLVLDFGGKYLFAYWRPPFAAGLTLGLTIDIAWVGSMVVTWLKVRKAHALAERLGIEVRGTRDDGDDAPSGVTPSGIKSSSEGSPPPPAA